MLGLPYGLDQRHALLGTRRQVARPQPMGRISLGSSPAAGARFLTIRFTACGERAVTSMAPAVDPAKHGPS